jgi:hypothetical protein
LEQGRGAAARRRWRPLGWLALIGLIGVALIVLASVFELGEPLESASKAVGEALIVTGLLGVIVEPPLRRLFAEDVARDAFLTLFGVNAPREYLEALEEVCRTDRLSFGVTWQVTIEWHDPTVLKLVLEAHNTLSNIGSKPMHPHRIWLMPSSEGAPPSFFRRLQYEIRDAEERVIYPPPLEKDELEVLVERVAGGGIVGPPDRLFREHVVPPRGAITTALTGELYLRTPAVVPLASKYPSLKTSFIVRGPALADINVAVKSGSMELNGRPSTDSAGRPVLSFEADRLTLPEHTYRLELTRQRADPPVADAPRQ